jgi:hypothetical protein
MFRRIYLDNSATTPVDREVVDAMIPFLTGKIRQCFEHHFFGQEARSAVDKARHQVAEIINSRRMKSSLLPAARKPTIWRFAVFWKPTKNTENTLSLPLSNTPPSKTSAKI